MKEVDPGDVNKKVNNLRVGSRDLEESKRREIAKTKENAEPVVEDLAEEWSAVGLSDREAEVAAYRQLGFTNKAVAFMLGLSPNTVNEYQRRASEKIQEARRLVSLADRSIADQKDIPCPNCGENIRRSHGDITAGGTELSIRCRSCFETHTRRVGRRL
jgi:DNA-binding CsgD family transcriptional regulator